MMEKETRCTRCRKVIVSSDFAVYDGGVISKFSDLDRDLLGGLVHFTCLRNKEQKAMEEGRTVR